jgi:predicted porin
MKQKILATMVGAVLAGGLSVAAADVVVFGHIDTSIDATDQDGGSDDINFHCNTCSIGFKGSEDLGNGLKAIFSLDFQYDVFDVSSKDALTDRDQWLGLAGSNWGQVRWGTISTPYKSHGAMIDPLYRTALQGRARGVQSDFHNGAGENLEGRAEYTMRYDTPDWNGLKAAAFYTLDSNESDGSGGTEDNDSYGVGVQYSNGNLLGFADWQDNGGSKKDVGGDISAWKAGGKYSTKAFGMDFGFYGQFEDASIDENSAANMTDLDFQLWHIAASVQLGNTMVYYAFGQGEYDNNGVGAKSDDYDTWTLALIHSMSKRTKLYAGFSEVDCDARVFEDTAGPPPSTGIDSSACGNIDQNNDGKRGEDDKFSVGMKHTF